jgi:hypothetical protein
MVKSLSETKYICEICHRIYTDVTQAQLCQQGHDIIYVPFQREDLKRLIAFLHIGERALLTESLIENLERYALLSSEPEPRLNNYVPHFD